MLKTVLPVLALLLALPAPGAAKCFDARWGRAPILGALRARGLSANVRVVRTGETRERVEFLVQNRARTDLVYPATVRKSDRAARVCVPTAARTVAGAEGLGWSLRRERAPGAGRFVVRRVSKLTRRGNYRIRSATDRNESLVVPSDRSSSRTLRYDR
jgi:hypothetical protein